MAWRKPISGSNSLNKLDGKSAMASAVETRAATRSAAFGSMLFIVRDTTVCVIWSKERVWEESNLMTMT